MPLTGLHDLYETSKAANNSLCIFAADVIRRFLITAVYVCRNSPGFQFCTIR